MEKWRNGSVHARLASTRLNSACVAIQCHVSRYELLQCVKTDAKHAHPLGRLCIFVKSHMLDS